MKNIINHKLYTKKNIKKNKTIYKLNKNLNNLINSF